MKLTKLFTNKTVCSVQWRLYFCHFFPCSNSEKRDEAVRTAGMRGKKINNEPIRNNINRVPLYMDEINIYI